jgi:beta-lactamase class A
MLTGHIKWICLSTGALLILCIGIGIGYMLDNQPNDNDASPKTGRELHSSGKLTSPLLECNIQGNVDSTEFNVFKNSLQKKIDAYKSDGKVTFTAIYLRHLLDGAWSGINLTEKFTPASLLKVADMITIYKMADDDPTILTKKLKYEKIFFTGQPYFEPDTTLVIGQEYTVDELVAKMVENSDNEAMFLIRANFDSSQFDKLYKDLQIAAPNDKVSDDFMTIKDYSAFFRILYNASYLSAPMSEKALSMLTKTKFNKALTDQIPDKITVAHKFGERLYTDDNTKQLHDCGIIYHPTDPYLLCIMTRGHNYDTLASVIADLSKTVWDEMQIRSQVASGTPNPTP